MQLEDCFCQPLYKDGHPFNPWMGRIFGDCAWTPANQTGFYFGQLQLLFFLVAQLPQIWQNYKRKSVEGLSLNFLLVWLLGDVTNFLGAFLTNLQFSIKATSVYFLLMDAILLGQFAYYVYQRRRKARLLRLRPDTPGTTSGGPSPAEPVVMTMPIAWMVLCLGVVMARPIAEVIVNNGSLLHGKPESYWLGLQQCDAKAQIPRGLEIVGIICAWVSASCYFFSRIPQLIDNYKRKSTDGVSITMFAITVAGNASYGLSIILQAPEIDNDFWIEKFPYILGSSGTLIFDFYLLWQARIYRSNNAAIAAARKEVPPVYKEILGADGNAVTGENEKLVKSGYVI